METNFSKGDWVVTQTERVECNNEIVALVYDGTAAPTACENIDFVTANANLISAAPDMFEQLTSIIDGTAFDKETGLIWEHRLEEIRKVLNKAVGSDSF